MSFVVSTTSPRLKRAFVDDSSMLTSASASSISRWISATALHGKIGKVACGERLQIEAGAAGTQDQLAGLAARLQRDLCTVGELAHDVVERMRWQGRAATLADVGGNALGHFEVEIGRL